MKNAKHLRPALAVILCVSLSCSYLKDKVSNLDGGTAKAPSIPPFNPNGRLVSPGAYVIRLMAKDEPALAALAELVEIAEQKMMKQIIDENRLKKVDENALKTDMNFRPQEAQAGVKSLGRSVAGLLMFQSGEVALPTAGDGAVFGGFTGFLKGMLASVLTNETFSKKDSKTEPVNGGTSKMNVEIGSNPDGSTVFEIGIITETEKNGVKARTESRSSIEGQDCPNAEGQVPFTIKMRLSGQSGNSRYEQEVTVFVRLVVNENAEIANTTMDINHGTSRTRNGQTSYFERALTRRIGEGESLGTLSNQRVVQKTDNVTLDDVREAAFSGDSVAYGAANAAIEAAQSAWQGGACVKIEAASPGTVDLNSSHEIPVKVIHKKEGIDVPSTVDAALSGQTSVSPGVIPKTQGTLTYIAPPDAGMQATIKLTANSRRGRATLDLTASTGGNSYRIVGGLDDFQTSTDVCDVMKPFTLTGGGFVNKFSGGLSGTSNYTGPFQSKGSGKYTISLPDGPGKPGTMTGQGSGSVLGRYTGTGTETYTLTPIPPCS